MIKISWPEIKINHVVKIQGQAVDTTEMIFTVRALLSCEDCAKILDVLIQTPRQELIITVAKKDD